ncbi:hypothetical protein DTO271D3_4073 [Paecilomyces variotii]|nr:hypothetical protein DTO169E5_470 [Paecilomyces variotii]KAJ9315500.1 hypothetical protein DTO271D3_4073 [Paecilomyces variotii]
MKFTLSPVNADDAESLVRKCDFPAMRDNPLHLLMFPHSCEEMEEEEIKWTIEGLEKTLQTRSAGFRKVCLEDGTPVGFAGWSLEQTTQEGKTTNIGAVSEEREEPNKCPRRDYWHPSTLDVKTWVGVSRMFRNEKKRVLENRKNIWRLNMISVNPAYQRQGIGSILLQWGTEEADAHGRDSFLISSPAGVRLYAKFGFKVVGEIHTPRGTFTSMFREAQLNEVTSSFNEISSIKRPVPRSNAGVEEVKNSKDILRV